MVDVHPVMDLDASLPPRTKSFRDLSPEEVARYRRAQAVSMAWVHAALTLPGPIQVFGKSSKRGTEDHDPPSALTGRFLGIEALLVSSWVWVSAPPTPWRPPVSWAADRSDFSARGYRRLPSFYGQSWNSRSAGTSWLPACDLAVHRRGRGFGKKLWGKIQSAASPA